MKPASSQLPHGLLPMCWSIPYAQAAGGRVCGPLCRMTRITITTRASLLWNSKMSVTKRASLARHRSCTPMRRRRPSCWGRHLSTCERCLRFCGSPTPWPIIEVPHFDFVDPINMVLRKHVLGTETPVLDGDGLSKRTTVASPGTVIIFESPEDTHVSKDFGQRCRICRRGAAALRYNRDHFQSRPIATRAGLPRRAPDRSAAPRWRHHCRRD